jgi:hypothetical protein
MPQHPARHHAPAHQRETCPDSEVEREIPRHAHGLADLLVRPSPRVHVAEREQRRLAPIAQAIPWCDSATVTVTGHGRANAVARAPEPA